MPTADSTTLNAGSGGDLIDSVDVASGPTVKRQVTAIGDGTTRGNVTAVDSAGNLATKDVDANGVVANNLSGDSGQNADLVAGIRKEVTFSTTTAQAVASTDVSNYRAVAVQVTGQGTSSTVTFQCSNDNSHWSSLRLTRAADDVPGTNTTTTNEMWVGVVPTRYFRLNITGITAGTTAGTVEFFSLTAARIPASVQLADSSGTILSTGMGNGNGDSNFPISQVPAVGSLEWIWDSGGAVWNRRKQISAAKDTTGSGLAGSGILAFDGTNYRVLRGMNGQGSWTVGSAGVPLAVSLVRADGQDFSSSENGWQNADNYNPGLSLAVHAMQMYANYGNSGNAGDRARTPNIWVPIAAVTITSETTIWTPGTGKKFRLMGAVLGAGATGGTVVLRDNTAGTVRLRAPIPANGVVVLPPMKNGYLSAAANNVLTAQGATGEVLDGYVFGTEE